MFWPLFQLGLQLIFSNYLEKILVCKDLFITFTIIFQLSSIILFDTRSWSDLLFMHFTMLFSSIIFIFRNSKTSFTIYSVLLIYCTLPIECLILLMLSIKYALNWFTISYQSFYSIWSNLVEFYLLLSTRFLMCVHIYFWFVFSTLACKSLIIFSLFIVPSSSLNQLFTLLFSALTFQT